MDVLSCSLKELEDAENEILGELSVLESQTLGHLQRASALVDSNGDRSGGINLFRLSSLDRADASVVDSFSAQSGSFRTQSLGRTDSGVSRAVSLGERPETGSNREANTLTSIAVSSRSSIGLGDNFYRIESFGNRLKTIANESDCVLNKLKCAVSIVECVSVLYQSASKLVEFFTEMSGSGGSEDEYSGYETQLGRLDGKMGDVLQLGAQERLELSVDDRTLSDRNMDVVSPVNMGKRGSLEKVNLSDTSKSMELLFEQVSRYIEQVELAKKNGYWNEALIVITKGYIGQVIASLKWAVLRCLSVTIAQVPSTSGSTVTHGSGETQINAGTVIPSNSASVTATSGANATIQVADRPKMLTRLAVCLGSEMEVFKCYLSAIRAEFHYTATSGIGSGSGVNKMTAGSEVKLLKNALKRARNALIYQANVVLSELGGRYYIQICREIHEHVSVEVASMFVEFVKLHFTPFLPATAPRGGAANSGDNAISNSGSGNVNLYNTSNNYSGTVNTQSGSINATLGSSVSSYGGIGATTNNSLNSFNSAHNSTVNTSSTTSSSATVQVATAASYNSAGVSNRGTSSHGTASGISNNNSTSYSTSNSTSLANDTHLASHNTLNPRDNARNSHNSHSNISYNSYPGTSYNNNASSNSNIISNNSTSNNGNNSTNNSNTISSNHSGIYSSGNATLYNPSTLNLHTNIATNSMHQSSRNTAISMESESLLSQLERALEDANVVETIVGDSKYQTVLDTIAIMASLWSDFESALRDSTRPVYSKLNISLLSHGDSSNPQNINTTNLTTDLPLNNSTKLPPNPLVSDNTYGPDGLVTLSLATKTLQSLLNAYVQIQHVFILKYVKQAILVDAIYQSVSTLVDDVFFILQKSQQRSIGTGDLQTACATFNQTSAIIGGELKTALVGNLVESRAVYERWAQKLENLSSSSVQTMLEEHFKKTLGSVPDSIGSKHSFVHSLNNVEECLGLLEKFKQEMSECFADRFFKEKQEKNLLIDNTIQTLDSVTTELEEILNTCCEYVFNILKDHLNDPLLKFGAIDFEMDDEKYSRSQNDESFADQLVSVLNIILGHLNTNYTPKVALKCMTNLVEKLSKYLETCTLSKRFTIYGAVYFDTAIRSLVYACSSYNQEIRKEFTTLLQISDVLNVNNRDDLMLLKESEYTIDISKYSGLRTDLTF
ncbi:hypothetical protein MACK_000531 [Theileria orientalis]|uniref:Component of oligomeric Golgi complex 4 n=1 Tax=Theileria orientalis TaxID=68886 RepID=A0A976QS58_THEOR|nr:hypothetical protein MACK_000531 [Theileria orientalis]